MFDKDRLKELENESISLTHDIMDQMEKLEYWADKLKQAQDRWDKAFYEFLKEEGETSPPGGGRWNQDKRESYVRDNNGAIWNAVREAEQRISDIQNSIKIMNVGVAHLNRVIRIYELCQEVD